MNSCPVCRHSDQIRKVSAILDQEIHKITTRVPVTEVYTDSKGKVHSYPSYQNVNSTQASQLAQRLAPPPKPSVGFNWGTLFKILGIFGLIDGIITFGGLFLVALVVVGTASVSPGDFIAELQREMPSISEIPLAKVILGLAPNFFLCVIGPLFSFLVIPIASLLVGQRLSAKHKAQAAVIQNQEIPRWLQAMERWERLYYCERDGVVFIPGGISSAPVAQMMNFIYR